MPDLATKLDRARANLRAIRHTIDQPKDLTDPERRLLEEVDFALSAIETAHRLPDPVLERRALPNGGPIDRFRTPAASEHQEPG